MTDETIPQLEVTTTREPFCMRHKGYHAPNAECVTCEFAPWYLHAPVSPGLHFDYRGWRFLAPFICMSCGIAVCHLQWAFSRSCGACDTSNALTARLIYGKCFAGPHFKLPTWSDKNDDIPEHWFVDYQERLNYPIRRRPDIEHRPYPAPYPRRPKRRYNHE